MPLEIFASGRDDPCWSPQAEDPPIRKHSTSGRLLCETVHAAGPNDGANFQVKITSRPNGLIGGTSCPRRRSHQTLTRHQGDPEPQRSFGSIRHRPRDGNVVSCLHCMNDPQPEGHMASHIGRRKFLATLGGAAAWPLAALAQQGQRMRRVGALLPANADDPDYQSWVGAFQQALAQFGWIIGRNVRIDARWAGGKADDIGRHVAELVTLAPDVILAHGTSTVRPLMRATRTVPIVFPIAADPVGAGFVDSLARPGGNATGFMTLEYSFAGKWLELLKQIAPGVTRVAVIRDATQGP